MQSFLSRRRLTQLFDIGIAIKALDGLLEVTGGLILSLLSPGQLVWLASMITRGELSEDPSDFFANLFLHTASRVTDHGKFVALVFLFSHGFIKLALAWELYRGKLRTYPLTMAVLSLFVVYQLVEIVRGHSLLLIALTALDVIIILLAWHEYRLRKQASGTEPDNEGNLAQSA